MLKLRKSLRPIYTDVSRILSLLFCDWLTRQIVGPLNDNCTVWVYLSVRPWIKQIVVLQGPEDQGSEGDEEDKDEEDKDEDYHMQETNNINKSGHIAFGNYFHVILFFIDSQH